MKPKLPSLFPKPQKSETLFEKVARSTHPYTPPPKGKNPNSWRCKRGRHDLRDGGGGKMKGIIIIASGLCTGDDYYCARCGKEFTPFEAKHLT